MRFMKNVKLDVKYIPSPVFLDKFELSRIKLRSHKTLIRLLAIRTVKRETLHY